MSIEIMNNVWDHSRQTGAKRLVLLALADASNHDGYCWPSLDYIATRCNCSRRYIIKIIADLECCSELYVDHRPGRTRGNVYFVTVATTPDNFAKRLIHYLDYGPTEALEIALKHLGKGELLSQKVNYSSEKVNNGSPLSVELKVNHCSEKVNYSREKVNYSREKVNYSSPDPIDPIDPLDPTTTTTTREPTDSRRGRPQPSTSSSPSPSLTRSRKTDAAYDAICTALESEGFGLMTPILAGQVNALMDRFPADWITRAIILAVGQNKRTLAYATGILNNMESEGFTHDQSKHHRERAGHHRQPAADNAATRRQREYNERHTRLVANEINGTITTDEAAQQWRQLEQDYPGFEYEELK